MARVFATALGVAEAGLFDCPALTEEIPAPRNISELHPSHVSIVMAVGDSITAAFSARSDIYEARNLSWAAGVGAEDQLTLPWLLEQYSPKVEGQSTKAVIPNGITHLPHGDYHPRYDGLNVAESSGAAHLGSNDEQWGLLMQQKDKYEDFDNRWKVLTYWMFANDVCGMCDVEAAASDTYKQWEKKTDEFLANVTSTFKNTYVNLVSMLDLSQIHRIQHSKIGCTIEHELILQECGCIDRGDPTELDTLDRNIHFMNGRLHQFAVDWQKKLRDQGREDIAVVAQWGFEGIGATLDSTFLSKLDCFHPSALAHQSLAVGLWNSMLCGGRDDVEQRRQRCGIAFAPDTKPLCPTKDSVFYTGPDVVPVPPLEQWTAQVVV
jgi:phospholipase B1